MEKIYKIYMHLNKINGKIYIGQTNRTNINDRYGKNGRRYAQCPRFGAAIQKYGWENFVHMILEDKLSFEEANNKERFYIALYHSTDKDYGYNVSSGGVINKTIPIEIRIKISNSLKGKSSSNIGRKCSEETKRKISKSKKGKSHANTTVWTEEMRKRHSELMRGRKKSQSAIEKLKKYSGQNAVWYGRHHTEETKIKLRQYCGEKASFYGKKHTQKYKDYMSKKVSGSNNQAFGKHWFTNGSKNYFGFECPEGFMRGVTRSIQNWKKQGDQTNDNNN